jgi:sporulation related protein
MADNNFRSDRSRDPLAELARLIGQGNPHAQNASQQSYGSERSAAVPAHVDWAAAEESYSAHDGHGAHDAYGAHDDHVDERYAPAPAPAAPQSSYAQQERGYENDVPAGRYFSGPAAQFNGFREEETDAYYDDPPPLPPARQLANYDAADHGYEVDEHQHGDDYNAADEYDDERPRARRRSGLVVAVAIFSLAVVGTAGAFGYRAMFGGSVLPTLPPIIKASNGPNRVAPASGDAQANNPGDTKQAGAGTTGSTETLLSREEQPVTIEPPRAAPRIVSTIPIVTSAGAAQGSVPAGMGAPGQLASAADPAWPPPPTGAPPASMAVATPSSTQPAPAPSEPKKIHTVTIRTDQSGGTDATPASTTPAAAPPAGRQSRTAAVQRTSAPPSGQNAPMSIVPGSQAAAPAPPPQRTRVSATSTAEAPMTTAASAGGGYAVQVTSQRSEGEAQSAYRSLQAKYPDQLGGRAPIIRRADLGEKGTYYRALVGPFASAEEAAGLCSGLKAAGGKCIVQRN